MKYALLSDIHEDLVFLQKAFHKIEKIGVDRIVCLGDISGFSARHYSYISQRNANECLRLIQNSCEIIIAGNHDLHAVRKTPAISPLFEYPENWYQNDYISKEKVSQEKIWLYDSDELDPLYTNDNQEYLKKLPEWAVSDQVLFTHYIYPNLTGSARTFYFHPEEFMEHQSFVKEKKCTLSFSGHQHHPGLIVIADNQILEKGFNRKVKLVENSAVLVPPIVRNKSGSGFCIFDTNQFTVEAKRI